MDVTDNITSPTFSAEVKTGISDQSPIHYTLVLIKNREQYEEATVLTGPNPIKKNIVWMELML